MTQSYSIALCIFLFHGKTNNIIAINHRVTCVCIFIKQIHSLYIYSILLLFWVLLPLTYNNTHDINIIAERKNAFSLHLNFAVKFVYFFCAHVFFIIVFTVIFSLHSNKKHPFFIAIGLLVHFNIWNFSSPSSQVTIWCVFGKCFFSSLFKNCWFV